MQGLVEISTDTKELATRAREGKLRPEEFQVCIYIIAFDLQQNLSKFS